MKYSIEIGKIVEGALKSDQVKVENYVKMLIEKLEKDGDERSASKFRNLLEGTNKMAVLHHSGTLSKNIIPMDSESGSRLADTQYPNTTPVDVILSTENMNKIDTFVDNYLHADTLREKGLDIPNTIMFSGPPGCGKTKCAEYIAQRLSLPLVTARLDSLISSYLGTTAKNIRQLFEYAERIPCVLFLDEFDAIAKARDDGNDLGELKRVVNSLLQNVDTIDNGSILFAATNHPQILDPAVWRRFSFRIDIGLPEKEERISMIKLFSGDTIRLEEKDIETLSTIFEGLNGSSIESIIMQATRDAVLKGDEPGMKNVIDSFFSYVSLPFSNISKEKESIKRKAIYLHEKGMTGKQISSTLGIPQTTAYRYVKK